MNLSKRIVVPIGFALALTVLVQVPVMAQTVIPNDNTTLKQIIIFGRHSIRSSTVPTSILNEYAVNPWPAFEVAPGCLTPRGMTAETYLGRYFRQYLIAEGLLTGNDQANVAKLYFRSNCIERSFLTAYYFWTGLILDQTLLPAVHSYPIQQPPLPQDPVFTSIETGVAKVNANVAAQQVQEIFNSGDALTSAYSGEFNLILNTVQPPPQEPSQTCASGSACVYPIPVLSTQSPPQNAQPPYNLTLTASTTPGTGSVINIGALQTALAASEPFVMQYADNLEPGWGLTVDQVSQLTRLVDLGFNIEDRSPYLSQVQSSNAASHILLTMRQAAFGVNLSGAFGNARSRVVVVISSDNFVAGLAGLLNLHWQLPGYQPDFCAPGGALVFELRQSKITGNYLVRVYYTAQSFDQLRNLTPLTQPNPPPETMQLSVPGGNTSATNLDVNYLVFQNIVNGAIAQASVEYRSSPPVIESTPQEIESETSCTSQE